MKRSTFLLLITLLVFFWNAGLGNPVSLLGQATDSLQVISIKGQFFDPKGRTIEEYDYLEPGRKYRLLPKTEVQLSTLDGKKTYIAIGPGILILDSKGSVSLNRKALKSIAQQPLLHNITATKVPSHELSGLPLRGIQVVVRTPNGNKIPLYRNSYALVVGNGNYTKGWDPLPGAIRDVKDVARALEKNGFKVTFKKDLTKGSFNEVFGRFCHKYGKNKDNRLLFYYAGHGHTLEMATGEDLGYLVMVDAPVPEKDPMGFNLSSVDMQAILTQAKMIKARHVLFMFDSCFSGSILNLRERVVPQNISDSVRLPVRQFITAGRANEPVPDHSIFKQAFLDLLEGRDKEPIPDGYITGEELGLYLKNKVPVYNPTQHPQYGKIRDIRLDKGDFVFQLASSGATVSQPSLVSRTTLSVSANVTGARVLVDGRVVGTTPMSDVEVSPGDHRITVEKQGYEPYRKRIRIDRGRSMSLYVDLSEARPRKGRLYVETEPEDAKVKILNIGPAFSQGMELDPGRYNVEVSASGYKTKKRWVDLSAGEDESINIRLEAVVAERPALSRQPGQKLTNNLGMEFVYIHPGSFMMGSPSNESGRKGDERQHRVTLIKGFYMQTTEVTQGQWKRVMGSNPSSFKNCGDDCPVEQVSWNDAQEFIRKLNRMEMTDKYRLPTEAEWEYAARAESTTWFCFGNDDGQLGQYAWYSSNSGGKTHSVAQKKPNAWGLYDMHGNVWEWCHDWHGAYSSGSVTDPTGPSSGSGRVDRGGSGFNYAGLCRSAFRSRDSPGLKSDGLGFRLAKNVSTTANLTSSTSNEINRDGVYVAYANGIVRDTKMGLEWKVGPDKDTDWNEARSWVQSLNLEGGGWRMPTLDELEGLYKKGAGSRNMTPLLKTTGWGGWSGETKGSSDAWRFGFSSGRGLWGSRDFSNYGGRAFAVRSQSDR